MDKHRVAKRSAGQTICNFLFLVKLLNILWAINQDRSRGFVTLVFLAVLNDNHVSRQLPLPLDFLSVWKTSVPFTLYYRYYIIITTMLHYYSLNDINVISVVYENTIMTFDRNDLHVWCINNYLFSFFRFVALKR